MTKEQKKENDRCYYQHNRDAIRAKSRTRYKDDPEYKEKALLNARRYGRENPKKVKAYRAANRKCRGAQTKAWRKDNREKVRSYAKQYRQDNKESTKQYQRDYHKANCEVLKAKRQQYNAENSDKIADSQRRYRKENALKVYSKNAKRRALLRGAKVEQVDYDTIYLRDKGVCGICGSVICRGEMTLDHIIPLSRGGEHSAVNAQVAHLSCNSSKGNKLMQEMTLA